MPHRSKVINADWWSTAKEQPEPARPLFDGLPDLLTPADLAGISGQCESTIRRLCSSGQLPAVRIGRRWYVPRTKFAEYCEGASNGAA